MPISKGEIAFNPETHEYTNRETGKKYLSVTQLLKKHGLFTDYSAVGQDVLDKAAARGSLIHEEVEAYIKTGEIGFTSELFDFIKLCKGNDLTPTKAEFIVYNDEYGIAGTVDNFGYIGEDADLVFFIGDNKTTSKLNKEALAWQLSVYAYLSDLSLTIEKLYGFHLLSDNKSKLVEVKRISDEEIQALLDAEKNGEIYQPPKAELQIANEDKLVKAQEAIEFYQMQLDHAKADMEELKGFLIKAMRDNGIKKYETDRLSITYVAPTTRATIDSTRLKKELPDIATQYSKVSEVKDTVRITLRNTDESAG